MVWLLVLLRYLRKSDLVTRAAATTFSFVFAIVPLLTTSLAFFTAFPALADRRVQLEQWLLSHLLPGAAREVSVYLARFSEAAATAGAVSSLVFFFSVLMLFRSLEVTYNHIWRHRRSRTWGERLTVVALFFLVGSLVAAAMVTLSARLQTLGERAAIQRLNGLLPDLQQLSLQLGNIALAWILFALANLVLPGARVRLKPALVGAVVAGTLWHLLKGGFSWYVEHLTSFENLYGAVGTVPVFFLWLLLTFILLLVSAAMAFTLQNLESLRLEDERARSPVPIEVCGLLVLTALTRDFQQRRPPVTALELSKQLELPVYLVEAVLPMLMEAGLVYEVESPTGDGFVPASSGHTLTVREVLHHLKPDVGDWTRTNAPPLEERLAALLDEASAHEKSTLEGVTIADLCQDVRPQRDSTQSPERKQL